MNELKLLPCNHCGKPAKIVNTNLGYGVECSKNGHLHNEGIYKTEEEATAVWNHRQRMETL